jgi:hypothetical protein
LDSIAPDLTFPSQDDLSCSLAGPTGVAQRLAAALDQRRLLVGVVFLAIFAMDLVRPTDIDLWWHLATGALIARTGAVPVADPFSFTALGRPWVLHEWLWELGLYWLVRLGGYRLAVLISAAIITSAFAILYRLLRQLGANEIVSIVLVVWAAVLAEGTMGVRPRELTHLFLAVYLSQLILSFQDEHPDGHEGQPRRLWALPPVMAIWVNVHGPYILGLVVLGAFCVVEGASWRLGRTRLPRHLLVVALATLAATAVNPRGLAMLAYPFSYYLDGDNPSFNTVTEFQSPSFHDPFYLLFAASLVAFMVLGPPRGRIGVVGMLLVVVFAVQALVSYRNVAGYALVATPVLALRLREGFGWARELPALVSTPRRVAINWLILAGVVGLAIWSSHLPLVAQRLQLGEAPSSADLPVAGVGYIDATNRPGPIFNEQKWGGYLIDRWFPRRPVFADGRVDMYGTALIGEYLDVVTARPDWKQVLDHYGVRTILIERDSALSTLLLADGGWDRVFQGPVEDVYVRRDHR